jgi:hypothetical protein
MSRITLLAALLAALAAGPGPAAAEDLRDLFPSGPDLHESLRLESFDIYTAETLWERINGEAELHRSYGLVEAAYALYAEGSAWEQTVQIALFRMPDALSAFGLYSAYRPPGKELPLGNGAAVDESQAFLWHGTWFAALEGFGPEGFTSGSLRRGIESLAATLGDPPPPPASVGAIRTHVDYETIMYRPDHLLGREALPPGVEGKTSGGRTYFMATTAVDAAAVLRDYAPTLEDSSSKEAADILFLRGIDPHRGPIVLVLGREKLAGVASRTSGLPDDGELESLLESVPHP